VSGFLCYDSRVSRLLEFLRLRPLVLVTAPFVLGIAWSPAPLWGILGAGAALVLLALLFVFRAPTIPKMALGALFGLAAGALRGGWERPPAPPPAEGWVEVRGRAAGASHRVTAGRTALSDTGDRHAEPARTVVIIDVEEWIVEGRSSIGRGRLRVQTREPLPFLDGGERLRVAGRIRIPRPPSNPGQFDRREWLRRQGIAAVLNAEEVEVLSGPSGISWRLQRVRRFLRSRLDQACSPRTAALSASLLFGDREGLDDSLALGLQRTGTTHFLAVSGFNVALVVGAMWGILVLCGVGGRLRTMLLLAAAWGYALVAGQEASVLRAAIMASVWLGADLVDRRPDPLVSLSAAAALILLVDPRQLGDVGFQLSFLAVLGILSLVPLLAAFLGATRTWTQKLAGMILVSLAAWLATAPVVQSQFHLLTPSVLVSNLLFCPLILVVMICGGLSIVLPQAGMFADLATRALAALAEGISAVPGSYFFVPGPSQGLVAIYYAGWTVWTLWIRLRPTSWKALLVPLLLAPLALPAFSHSRPAGTRLAVLDVGRGGAGYVEFPDGRNFLFDAGSLDYRDAGATVVAPYLWSRGVFRVDTLFLSHPDADHVNGARSLVERFRIRRLVVSRSFGRSGAGAELLAWMRDRGVLILEIECTSGPAEIAPGIEILGPPPWEKYGKAVPTNETSLVLRIDRRILLTGDVEEVGTAALLETPDLRADVFVVPHHGKYQRCHAELLGRVRPTLSIVPGPESYASDRVLRELRARGKTWVVGSQGAVEVELAPDGMRSGAAR